MKTHTPRSIFSRRERNSNANDRIDILSSLDPNGLNDDEGPTTRTINYGRNYAAGPLFLEQLPESFQDFEIGEAISDDLGNEDCGNISR